ncbi:MAG: hypothetical protein U0573_07875 [Phycisphaerales bacterium]|nr:hypothetical protein [Planctomycetota bacterium]
MKEVSAIHASPALIALRRGATIAALVLITALAGRSLVFAFVHFTEIRFAVPEPELKAAAQLKVVEAKPTPKAPAQEKPVSERQPGRGNAVLAASCAITNALGIPAAFLFTLECWAAVVVGAGAGVIGVHRSIRASILGSIIVLAALGWALPGFTPAGVFGPYGELVGASEAVRAGTRHELVLVFMQGVLPIVLIAITGWAAFSLRVGVAAGIVVGGIDPRIEAEIAAVQQHGAGSLYAVRSAGDLNRAMAAATQPETVRFPGENEAQRVMADLEKLAGRRPPMEQPLRPTGTDPLRRPI